MIRSMLLSYFIVLTWARVIFLICICLRAAGMYAQSPRAAGILKSQCLGVLKHRAGLYLPYNQTEEDINGTLEWTTGLEHWNELLE